MTDPLQADPVALIDRQKLFVGFLMNGWTLSASGISIPGLPLISSCGVGGNGTVESDCRSVNLNVVEESNGALQWLGDRLIAMKAFCVANFGSWQALGPQSAFFGYECMTQYPALWADLMAGTKPLKTLTANICTFYERPGIPRLDERIADAEAIFATMLPSPPPPPPPPPPPLPPPTSLTALEQNVANAISTYNTARQNLITQLAALQAALAQMEQNV
jgi:Phage tail lysozyme